MELFPQNVCLEFVVWTCDIILIELFLVANGKVDLKEVMDGVKATTGRLEIINLRYLTFTIVIFYHYL